MMHNTPLVSVIMPVYNGARYITEAIESILNQTYTKIELIVVNDGSTDNTEKIVKNYEGRIHSLHQENHGVAHALNTGIRQAKGKYLARLDSDDIAIKTRFECQVDFLEKNPDIGIMGSASYLIDAGGKNWGVQKPPESDMAIRWFALFKSPFISSSTIFRRECFDWVQNGFNENLVAAEDYDMWIRLLGVTKAVNSEKPLIRYRMHPTNLTTVENERMISASVQISNIAIRTVFPNIDSEITQNEIDEMRVLLYASQKNYRSLSGTRTNTINNYLKLWRLFVTSLELSEKEIDRSQVQMLTRACQMAFYPPLPINVGRLPPELNKIDRKWWQYFLASIPSGLLKILRGRFFWKNL